MGLIITSESKVVRTVETKRIGTLPNGKFIVAFAETYASVTNSALYSRESAEEVSKTFPNVVIRRGLNCSDSEESIPSGDERSCKSYNEGIALEEEILDDSWDPAAPIISHWVLGLKSMRSVRKNLGDDPDWGVVLNPYTLVMNDPSWAKDYEVFHYIASEGYYTDLNGIRIDCCIRGTLEEGGLDGRKYDLEAIRKYFSTREDVRVLDEVEVVQVNNKYDYSDKFKVLCWEYTAPVTVCDGIFKQARESGLFSVQDMVIHRLGLAQFKYKECY